jgi:hypothetical protein
MVITCGLCFYDHHDCYVGKSSELGLYSVIGENSKKQLYCNPICYMRHRISNKQYCLNFPEWEEIEKVYIRSFSKNEYNKLRNTLLKNVNEDVNNFDHPEEGVECESS